MKLKYVLTEYNNFAIFSPGTNHNDIASKMHGKPISAGFCYITALEKNTEHISEPLINCFGESVSLKLKSRPEDSKKLTELINDPYN